MTKMLKPIAVALARVALTIRSHEMRVPNIRQFTRILSGGIAVALLGVGLSACDPTEADPRLEPPLVRIATVQPAASSERAFTGIISARIQSNLGFRVGGKIIERLVDTGQSVKLGQPLMKLDRADLDLAIAARDKAVEAAAEDRTFHGATRTFQIDLLRRSLDDTGWNVSATARLLDLSRSHLNELIRAFGLKRKA